MEKRCRNRSMTGSDVVTVTIEGLEARKLEYILGARERCRIGLDPGLALLHPEGRGHAAGEFGEHLPKHALAAVTVDDALVVNEIGRGFRDRALRDAGRDRLLLQIGEETIKTCAIVAGGGARGGRCYRPRRRSGRLPWSRQ